VLHGLDSGRPPLGHGLTVLPMRPGAHLSGVRRTGRDARRVPVGHGSRQTARPSKIACMTDLNQPAPSRRASSAPLGRLLAVMDFDGTITQHDCMDTLFRRYLEGYQELISAMRSGELRPADAVRRGVSELPISGEQVLDEFAEAAVLREGFAAFLHRLLAGGGRAAVISAGFREGIERAWLREGLPHVRLFAGELLDDPANGHGLELHAAFGDCELCGPRACKGPIVEGLRRPGDIVAAFGDGQRDLCMARRADLVFARSGLARSCEREGIAYVHLGDFKMALETMAERLAPEGTQA
jgi:2-hydroxy-3-keto-5-methylthiopentenyl-1-phosphate phosphatase